MTLRTTRDKKDCRESGSPFSFVVVRSSFVNLARWRIASDSDAAMPRQTQTDNAASGNPCGA